jgi:aminomethyltransferase
VAELKHTPLHDWHADNGARLIDFGGWHMPVQYKTGIIKEHKAVRSSVGLFDVSHMGEVYLRGDRAAEAVQRVVTNAVSKLVDGTALYTVMCYENGGIVDDCIVYRRADDEYMIILNASNVDKDLAWIRKNVGDMCEVDDQSDATALIAVQGPKAAAVVQRRTDAELGAVERFHFIDCEVAGVRCMAARTGYTGEDGFELACPAGDALTVWSELLAAGEPEGAVPIGLGARDTLRLEARLCLYGNDIDETTTPLEAGLGWVVKPSAGDWIGKAALRAQKEKGIERKLIGFRIEGRGIARHGYPIVDREREGDAVIGEVTSGTTGITVGGAIGMGYVPIAYSKPGTQISVECRGKDLAATVVKGPFYRREES